MRYATLLLLATMACNKGSEETDRPPRDTDPADTDPAGDTDTDREPIPECVELEVERCADRLECRLVKGHKIVEQDTGGYCVAFQLKPEGFDLGCRHADDECPGTEAWGHPEGKPDACYYFEIGCVPEGFQPCDASMRVSESCSDAPPA